MFNLFLYQTAPNGWLGKHFVSVLVDQVKNNGFGGLYFLTSKTNDTLAAAAAQSPDKIKVFETNYDSASLATALKGVDVVTVTMGVHGKEGKTLEALLDACTIIPFIT